MIAKRCRLNSLQEGFSFIEIIVVVLIMGLLLATVGPAAYSWLAKGKVSTTKTSLNALSQAIDAFHAELGSYPKALEDLIKKPSGPLGKNWTNPYLQKTSVPQDGWNHPFNYKVTPGAEHPYELYSDGPHGDAGPEEEHISVWEL